MITKFNKFINESLLDKMKGKDKEEAWKSLGYDRTFDTPEEFFLDIIKDIKIEEQDEYPDSVCWEKNGETIFEQDFEYGYLYVNSNKIWDVFKSLFNINNQAVRNLIRDMTEKHLGWKGLIPRRDDLFPT